MLNELFENIPYELKTLNQWVVWRLESRAGSHKPTKIPYDPKNGKMASSTNYETWGSYLQATDAFNSGHFSGIGFVFTKNDPYCLIDLDPETDEDIEFCNYVLQNIQSYSELSPSGKGAHIICKASVTKGHHNKSIGLFSSERYGCFTGNIISEKQEITEQQEVVNELFEFLGGKDQITFKYQFSNNMALTDEEIFEKASNATDGDKFNDLWNGDFEKYNYPSQSEADQALINMLEFYSNNYNQICRLFHSSELGQRQKAYRLDYLNGMISKATDRHLDEMKINDIISNIRTNPNLKREEWVQTEYGTDCPAFPPGIIGEVAQFILDYANRPVPLYALAAGISILSGIVGKAYNISGTGCNTYLCVLGTTGSGKEIMSSGATALLSYLRMNKKDIDSFLGPSEFASSQGLFKSLVDKPCYVSIFGEFSLRLKQIHSYNAGKNEFGSMRLLLELFNKSGARDTIEPIVYSNRENNTCSLKAPSFSLLCESIQDSFWKIINEEMIQSGLIPRFSILEYGGPTVPHREDSKKTKPSNELIQKLLDLIGTVNSYIDNDKVVDIQMTDLAKQMSKNYDLECVNKLNEKSKAEVHRQLWSRAHLKILRLAALVAIGINPYNPILCEDCFEWAKNFIEIEINNTLAHFNNEDIGDNNNESKQLAQLKEIVYKYTKLTEKELEKYKKTGVMIEYQKNAIIPYNYIQNRTSKLSTFNSGKIGASYVLKNLINILTESGILMKISEKQSINQWKTKKTLYQIVDMSLL